VFFRLFSGLRHTSQSAIHLPLRNAILRGCDFFVFAQKAVLKSKHLRVKKSEKFKKVTVSEGKPRELPGVRHGFREAGVGSRRIDSVAPWGYLKLLG
jgi:hypothetical protein